jgi:predicted transcriptional regulator
MKKTTIKYAAMLQEVKDACKKNERIVGKELGTKYRATNNMISSLRKIGWIEKVGTARYNWVGGEVTLEMATKLAEFINEQTNGKRPKKEPKAQPKAQPKTKEVKPVKTETISWFWGLYTKTVKG